MKPNIAPPAKLKIASEETSVQISRRSVLQGAAAIVGGAAASALALPEPASAQSHDAEGSRFSGDRPTASIHRNIVDTEYGKVGGSDRGGIVVFKGIPYGGPTAGSGRFMPPTKAAPWTGVRSCLHWGWVSPQDLNSSVSGRRKGWEHDDEAFMFQWDDGEPSEDCLRLNIWTPAADNKKRPVMFWIHGGGFSNGSSNEQAAYDGENLARRGDVVVVSVNHRLGVLGYLNLMDFGDAYASSANVGMLDIIAALEWVKTNISNFGGDPGTVMLFGQSGGGGKISALMGMPAAKGLFHRASIQSSGTPIHQGLPVPTAGLAAALLKQLGLNKSNIQKLHELPFRTVVEAGVLATRGAAAGGYSPSWTPVVDGRLLPRHSWDPAAPEFSADVPLLVGSLLNEMGNSIQMGDPALEEMSLPELKKRLATEFKANADGILTAFQQAHPGAKPFDLYCLISGMPRRVYAVQMATLKTQQGKAPAYNYLFRWQTPLLDGRPRAFHCAELPFVFFNTERSSSMTGGGPVPLALSEKMADAWISFARSGNPNHPGLAHWPAFSPSSVPTMVFDNTCEVKNNYDASERNAMSKT